MRIRRNRLRVLISTVVILFTYGLMSTLVSVATLLDDTIDDPSQGLTKIHKEEPAPQESTLKNVYGPVCQEFFDDEKHSGKCLSTISTNVAKGKWRDSRLAFNVHDDLLDLRRVLLVVYFNEPHYVVAAKTYALYHKVFGEVVFCGPEDSKSAFWPVSVTDNDYVRLPSTVKFVNIGSSIEIQPGELSYKCFGVAINDPELNAKERFDGILVSADDMALNVWTWRRSGKQLDKTWPLYYAMPDNLRRNYYVVAHEVDRAYGCLREKMSNDEDCHEKYTWAYAREYKSQMKSFYNELEQLAASDKFWGTAKARLDNATRGTRRLYFGGADTFYVAKKHWNDLDKVFDLLAKHRVWLELAVGSGIAAAVPTKDYLLFDERGHDFGADDKRKQSVMEKYSSDYEIFHPMKVSSMFSEKHVNYNLDPKKVKIEAWNAPRYMKNDTTMECIYCYMMQLLDNYADLYAATTFVPSLQQSQLAARGHIRCHSIECMHQQMWWDVVEEMSEPSSYVCLAQKSFGSVGAAEMEAEFRKPPFPLCFDRKHRLVSDECLIYSFMYIPAQGKSAWSFEDELASYGCDVYLFDPVRAEAPAVKPGVTFLRYGVQGMSRETYNISQILGKLSHEKRVIDVLKLDVEGDELEILHHLLESRVLARQVRSLVLEWHIWNNDEGNISKLDLAVEMYRRLRNEAQFELFYSNIRKNPYGFLPVQSYVNRNLPSEISKVIVH